MRYINTSKITFTFLFINLFTIHKTLADTVIADDLIIQQSECVGEYCEEDEDFGFNTLILKSDTPQLYLNDTSSSTSFSSNDWRVGVLDAGSDDAGDFFVEDVTGDEIVLQISTDGYVAIGSGSEIVDGALSVGSDGYERRITYVADGVDDTDAVTLGQFKTYKDSIDIDAENDAIDAEIEELETLIETLTARVEALADAIE